MNSLIFLLITMIAASPPKKAGLISYEKAFFRLRSRQIDIIQQLYYHHF